MEWRKTAEYRQWRAAVIDRDKRCKCCGHADDELHAHHIKHAHYNQDLRFTVSNGVTLCDDCHSVLHNKIAGGYRVKCDGIHLDRLLYIKAHFEAKLKPG